MTLGVGILVDLLLVAIVAVNFFRGYKNGFLATLFRLFVWLFASVIAIFLCQYLAQTLYDNVFHDQVVTALKDMQLVKDSSGNIMVEESIATIGGFMGAVMMFAKGAIAALLTSVDSRLVEIGINNFADQISQNIVRPMFINVASIALFLVVVIVLGLIFSLVVKGLKVVNKVPLVGTVNKVAGLAAGAALGVVLCLVITQAVKLLFMVMNKSLDAAALADNTIIFQFFYKIQLFH